MLAKGIPNPLVYVFYISAISMLSVLLLPLTHTPSLEVFNLASASTLLWTLAAYFMFRALRVGQLSRVIPVIGTLTPLLLLIIAFKTSSITVNEVWAAGILILGLIIITAKSWIGKIKKEELFYEALAALLFAASYIILKQAFKQGDFLQVLVYSRFILIPFGVIILLIPHFKRQIFESFTEGSLKNSNTVLFAVGQTSGGLSQLLLNFSISLASPALVNSLQGSQYVFLLILSFFLSRKFPQIFKEETGFKQVTVKVLGVILICLGIYVLAFSSINRSPVLGVSFSPRYAFELGLNPKATYIKMLDDLKVKRIRLPVYWNEVETFPQRLNFTSLDFYVQEAQKRDVKIVLVVGLKQPRWPECFAPAWVSKLMRSQKEARILDLVKKEVEYFKRYSNIVLWQVENEPLFGYGICGKIDQASTEFLQKEVGLVKSLNNRPIMVTDSGEMGFWIEATKLSDFFGTTLYRQVWSPYFGIQDYPLPPFFYTLKDKLVRIIAGKSGATIISELQAEPWIEGAQPTAQAEISKQVKILPVSKLKGNIEYAKETGFPQIYLWGVEWWYFMAKNGNPEYLEYAKTLF